MTRKGFLAPAGCMAVVVFALSLASGAAFAAAGMPQGGVIQVASYSGNTSADFPWVARDPAGNFLVVWLKADFNPPVHWNILGQRYTPAGLPLGGAFQINQAPLLSRGGLMPDNPRVAMNAQGEFVVVWDDFGFGVSAVGGRRYARDGTPVGAEFRILSVEAGRAFGPNVAIDAAGNFAVAWASEQPVYLPEANLPVLLVTAQQVHVQRFTARAIRAGLPILVDTGLSDELSTRLPPNTTAAGPAVAMDAAGNFVVAWENSRAGRFQVVARRYSSSGLALGKSFPVSSTYSGRDNFPQIAMDAAGEFVLVWQGAAGTAARRFLADGTAAGPEVALAGGGSPPVIAMDPLGNFAVAWWSAGEIYAQIFSTSLAPFTAAFPAFPSVSGSKSWPAVAMDAAGNLVIVATYNRSVPQQIGIVAQRFSGP